MKGEQGVCPHCGQTAEVYSRITGYYRPVQNWNDGKAQEFRDRRVYNVERSRLLRRGVPLPAEAENENGNESESVPGGGNLLLFATKTCPNCRQAEKLLNDAGLAYRKVFCEDEPELARAYGVRQAPTLVSPENPREKLIGVGAVRSFVLSHKVS